MRAEFLGKDPESHEGDSPTLFATDRTDRSTFIAQGWIVTDHQALADVGPLPEVEPFRRFLAGELDNFEWADGWHGMIRQATAQGKIFARVRVVSLPLSDYSRYGLRGSQFTGAAGEDIRYVARDVARKNGLPEYDYWLFDSRKLVEMHFGDDDRFLHAEVIEDATEIVKHNYWRDVAQHCAIRRDDFVAKQG